jgi:hypothetical protein
VFALLLQLIELRKCSLFGSDWIELIVDRTTAAVVEGQCSQETGARLAGHLREWVNNPELAERVRNLAEGLHEGRKEILRELMTNSEPGSLFRHQRSSNDQFSEELSGA